MAEYGMGGEVSTQGDVYSYGILLMEMFTWKGSTDDMFNEGLSLHQFAKKALPSQVMEIADQQFFVEYESIDQCRVQDKRARMQDCLISVFEIGVLCSTETSIERMEMKDAVTKMHKIRDLYYSAGCQNWLRFQFSKKVLVLVLASKDAVQRL